MQICHLLDKTESKYRGTGQNILVMPKGISNHPIGSNPLKNYSPNQAQVRCNINIAHHIVECSTQAYNEILVKWVWFPTP